MGADTRTLDRFHHKSWPICLLLSLGRQGSSARTCWLCALSPSGLTHCRRPLTSADCGNRRIRLSGVKEKQYQRHGLRWVRKAHHKSGFDLKGSWTNRFTNGLIPHPPATHKMESVLPSVTKTVLCTAKSRWMIYSSEPLSPCQRCYGLLVLYWSRWSRRKQFGQNQMMVSAHKVSLLLPRLFWLVENNLAMQTPTSPCLIF